MGCNTAGQFCIWSTFSYVFIHGKWTKFEAGVQTHVCGIVRITRSSTSRSVAISLVSSCNSFKWRILFRDKCSPLKTIHRLGWSWQTNHYNRWSWWRIILQGIIDDLSVLWLHWTLTSRLSSYPTLSLSWFLVIRSSGHPDLGLPTPNADSIRARWALVSPQWWPNHSSRCFGFWTKTRSHDPMGSDTSLNLGLLVVIDWWWSRTLSRRFD